MYYNFFCQNNKKKFSNFTVLSLSPDRRACEPCSSINDIVNSNGECEPCPEGSFPDGERRSCSHCKADEKVNFDGSCKRCPDGFVPTENHKFCKQCWRSLIAVDGICQPCPNQEKEWLLKTEAEPWISRFSVFQFFPSDIQFI